MDRIKNPFSPGAGWPPPAMIGRDEVMENARILLGRTLLCRHEKSMMLTGLRGVGKTVLLNKIERMAMEQGYKTILFEVQEGQSLAQVLATALRNILYELNLLAGAGDKVRRGLMVLRNFIGAVKLSYGDFGIDLEPLPGMADTGNMEIDLPELFLAVAEAARERNTGMALLVDEVQLLSLNELSALILAMHKLQQKQAPFVLIGAGLPTLPRLAGEAKSYAERLFSYPIIGQLSREEAARALSEPVEQEGAYFEQEALDMIYEHTMGYPYFLQEWGYQVWNQASGALLTKQDVLAASDMVIRRLDQNFFRVRYDRLTESEKRFMRAMAELDAGECRCSEIAPLLGMKPTALTPTRANLIRKGMIYSPRHGVIDYSVPLFGEFLRRALPQLPPRK